MKLSAWLLLLLLLIYCAYDGAAFSRGPISVGALPPGRWRIVETNDDLLLRLYPAPIEVMVHGNYFMVNRMIQGSFSIGHLHDDEEEEEEQERCFRVRMSLWGLPFQRHYRMGVVNPKAVVLTRKRHFYKLCFVQ